MERVNQLLAYLNHLDSIRDKPVSGNMMKAIDEKILMVCAEIENELGVKQSKSNHSLDIPLTIDVNKIAEAVKASINKREAVRPFTQC